MDWRSLATLIGQPSGGTNGNIKVLKLPGDYLVPFTGMKVFKPDGTSLHGTGILPDIYVTRTLKGVIEGRDEYLEKAMSVAEEYLRNKGRKQK